MVDVSTDMEWMSGILVWLVTTTQLVIAMLQG